MWKILWRTIKRCKNISQYWDNKQIRQIDQASINSRETTPGTKIKMRLLERFCNSNMEKTPNLLNQDHHIK